MCHLKVKFLLTITVGTLAAAYILGFYRLKYDQEISENVVPVNNEFCEEDNDDTTNNMFDETSSKLLAFFYNIIIKIIVLFLQANKLCLKIIIVHLFVHNLYNLTLLTSKIMDNFCYYNI